MAQLAHKDMEAILGRLKDAIAASNKSLRAVAADSARLDPPESVHHSNLSEILRGKEGRGLYLQTFIAVCKIVGKDPAAVLYGEQEALVMRAMSALPRKSRVKILTLALHELEEQEAPASLRSRLRQAL